jgi:hypothetical protein
LITRSDGAYGRRICSYAPTGIAVAGLALAGLAGCARTSVEDVNVKAVGLPRPQLIIVHDFGVSPSAVALDTPIGSRILEAVKGNPEAEEQLKIGQVPIRDSEADNLSISSPDVLARIRAGEAGWERFVPAAVADAIVAGGLFGYRGGM